MSPRQLARYRKTKARAANAPLAGERFEQPLARLLRNARAVVGKIDRDDVVLPQVAGGGLMAGERAVG